MAHKVHPKAYRLKEMKDFDSRWFVAKDIGTNLESDYKIRAFLEEKLREAGIQGIEIERFAGKIKIIINTARPGVVIGRAGKGVEDLKKFVENKIVRDKTVDVKFEIREIKNPWTNSLFIGQFIAQQIEKRMPYRRALKQAMTKMKLNKEIQGAKITVSGRLNGSTIARTEWLAYGKLPRQTIRAIIDYGFYEARCTYGTIGIKVWLYKGEKFE